MSPSLWKGATDVTKPISSTVLFLLALLLLLQADIAFADLDLAISTNESCTIGGVVAEDHEIPAVDPTYTTWQLHLTGMTDLLPDGANIDALDCITPTEAYFSLEADAKIGATLYADEDIIYWSGSTLSLAWDGSSNGLPDETNLDALDVSSTDPLKFDFSLESDATLTVGGSPTLVADEDIVQWSGGAFSNLSFDGSSEGVPAEADLDAFSMRTSSEWVISFNIPGQVGGIDFDDGDLLPWYSGGSGWGTGLFFDASANSVPDEADLNACEAQTGQLPILEWRIY